MLPHHLATQAWTLSEREGTVLKKWCKHTIKANYLSLKINKYSGVPGHQMPTYLKLVFCQAKIVWSFLLSRGLLFLLQPNKKLLNWNKNKLSWIVCKHNWDPSNQGTKCLFVQHYEINISKSLTLLTSFPEENLQLALVSWTFSIASCK